MNAWDQLPNEPNMWYRRFERYLRMGPTRTIIGCYNEERAEKGEEGRGRFPGSWARASDAWDWEARAAEYDGYHSQIAQDAWDERFKAFQEKKWEIVEKLLQRANQMLDFPLAEIKREETTENGRLVAITHIHPARWTFRDAAAMLEAVAKLMEPHQANDNDDKPAVQINLSGLPVEVLRAIADEGEQGSDPG